MKSQADIRKWFMKSHDKGNSQKPVVTTSQTPSTAKTEPKESARGDQDNSGRRKASKYFPPDKPTDDKETSKVPAKRKPHKDPDESIKPLPAKKAHKVIDDDDDEDDFVSPNSKKKSVDSTPSKKLKSTSGVGIPQKVTTIDEGGDDDAKAAKSPLKPAGRGRGGRGTSAGPTGGRGRGAGRGGFMNFGERKDPPHKGEKV
ncbi:hypothetical protein C1H46_020869 [Malus baccata]|uniref:Uncharacterized protein n=1 Tax=Malus baccata TaxID=106549 RepID=A0A540M4U0_MALBA|nr:hypothetical protein C1H46_020869 [Malus baccata]